MRVYRIAYNSEYSNKQKKRKGEKLKNMHKHIFAKLCTKVFLFYTYRVTVVNRHKREKKIYFFRAIECKEKVIFSNSSVTYKA